MSSIKEVQHVLGEARWLGFLEGQGDITRFLDRFYQQQHDADLEIRIQKVRSTNHGVKLS